MPRSTSRMTAPRGARGTSEASPGDRVTDGVTVLRGANRHPQVRGIAQDSAKGDGVTGSFEIRYTCAHAHAGVRAHVADCVDVSPCHPRHIMQSYHILKGDRQGVADPSPLSVTRHPSLHTFGNTRKEHDE